MSYTYAPDCAPARVSSWAMCPRSAAVAAALARTGRGFAAGAPAVRFGAVARKVALAVAPGVIASARESAQSTITGDASRRRGTQPYNKQGYGARCQVAGEASPAPSAQ